MGYNTVLFLCNDHLRTIEERGGELGKAIGDDNYKIVPREE